MSVAKIKVKQCMRRAKPDLGIDSSWPVSWQE